MLSGLESPHSCPSEPPSAEAVPRLGPAPRRASRRKLPLEAREVQPGARLRCPACLSDARDMVTKLTHMITSMLDVSRLESNQMPLQRTSVDLLELVHAACAHVGAKSRARVQITGDPAVGAVSCDAELIKRVLQNLIGNALDYSPTGAPVSVAIVQLQGQIRVEVSDHGPGISSEMHVRIFEKFGQAEPKTDRKSSSGIGLTFCKLAIEAHDGAIGVKSETGKGSMFWFELPVG